MRKARESGPSLVLSGLLVFLETAQDRHECPRHQQQDDEGQRRLKAAHAPPSLRQDYEEPRATLALVTGCQLARGTSRRIIALAVAKLQWCN